MATNCRVSQACFASIFSLMLYGNAVADTHTDVSPVAQINATADPVRGIFHQSDTTLFEWVENGASAEQFVALKFSAGAMKKGEEWAECQYSLIYINRKQKRSEITMYRFSSEDGSIKNLSVSSNSVSFDLDTGWFVPGGGDTRKIRFVATRKGSTASVYQASAVALWQAMEDETKTLKIEWKQVRSIELPFTTISN